MLFALFGLSLAASSQVHAQANNQTSSPTPAVNQTATREPVTREQRAEAYAKLLEGQRHLAIARRARDFESPHINDARAAFVEAVRLNPALAEGYTALAEIHFTMSDLVAAEREARRAVVASRDNFGAHRLLSRVYALRSGLRENSINRSAAEQAIAELREVIRLSPSDAEGWALLGELYAATNRDGEAIEAFTHWAAAPPTFETLFYPFLNQGRELSQASANVRLGGALLRAGRAPEAVAAFRRALAIEPENPGYIELLGIALDAVGNDATSIAAYEEILAARGGEAEAATTEESRQVVEVALGGILAAHKRAGRRADARVTVERMRRLLSADNPAADRANVELLRDENRRPEALSAAQAARGRFPEDSSFVWLEASLLAELNRADEGAALLRARLTGGPRDYQEYLGLASVYLQAGRGRDSVEAARHALEIAAALPREIAQRPTNEALIMLASGQERAGDFAGAEESLRRVLASDPNNRDALNNLGYFLVERNERLNEALELIQRALRLNPNSSSILDSLGWAYFKLGRLDEAERYLVEAARRDPTSTAIQEHLGDLYFRQGRTDQARAAWQRALTLSVETSETARLRAKLSGAQTQ